MFIPLPEQAPPKARSIFSPPLAPPSPPATPAARKLKAPREDYLTHAQATQLHTELLAGCEVPAGYPRSITHSLAIGDTGCARSIMIGRGD